MSSEPPVSTITHRATRRSYRPRRRASLRGRATRVWAFILLAMVVVPLGMSVAAGPNRTEGMVAELSLAAGLVAASLLVAAFALPSRVRAFTAQLGIETVLRVHRAIAVLAVVFVVGHILLVVASDPEGLAILDLRNAPPRVWAATTATGALLLTVVLAATRRRRKPRYEGWRLAHICLAFVMLAGTALHILWLQNMVDRLATRIWFTILLGCALAVIGYRWFWRSLRSRLRPYVVGEVRIYSPTSAGLVLRAHRHTGVPFRAGQFFWLKFSGSPYTFEEHPFTAASSANDPARKEFIIKESGDFTELLAAMRPGRRIYIDGPHGSFTMDGLRTPSLVFIAGGVGITPMLSMLRTLASDGDPRPILLVTAARTVDDLLCRGELHLLRRRLRLWLVEVLSQPPAGWPGETGRVDAELLGRYLFPQYSGIPVPLLKSDYFLCGPPAMVSGVLDALNKLGIPEERVHTELFDTV
jgi:3-phenylpropionate/trans-cinnamate dioxygenase ferredoxin reductase subunit